MKVPATVQRMVTPAGGLPHIEHHTRDAALFAESEWGWSLDGREAYVFPAREKSLVPGADELAHSAEFHVETLKAQGAEHVWSCVFGEAARAEREHRREDKVAKMEASVREAGRVSKSVHNAVAPHRARRQKTIAERVEQARKGRRRRHVGVSPDEVYARLEREGLA